MHYIEVYFSQRSKFGVIPDSSSNYSITKYLNLVTVFPQPDNVTKSRFACTICHQDQTCVLPQTKFT